MTTKSKTNTKRVSLDLPPAIASEIERLRKLTGLTSADLFRHSITLLRIYVDTKLEEKEFRIINPNDLTDQIRLEMPISIEMNSTRQT